MADRTDTYRQEMNRVSAMTEANQVRPEHRDEEDRLQRRMDLERERGHIHTSYGWR